MSYVKAIELLGQAEQAMEWVVAPPMEGYQLNIDGMQIINADSNGWRLIEGTHTLNGYHVTYVNADGRIWAQRVTMSEFVVVEAMLRRLSDMVDEDEPYDERDYGMGVW